MSASKKFRAWVRDRADEFVERASVTVNREVSRDQEVNPVMKVTDFYEGAVALSHPKEYKPDPQFGRREDRLSGWNIEMNEIFCEKDGDTPGSVIISGPAGSGKTMALKRFVRDNAEDFNFVLALDKLRDTESQISVFDFLFPNREYISDDIMMKGYEWMVTNSHEITFIIDSLDTIPFKLLNKALITSCKGLHTPATILSSILAKKIFPECRILASSREHGVTDCPRELRGDRIVSVVGLTNESVRKHVHSVLEDDEGKLFFKNVEKKHPGLWALLTTPLFLVFTIIGYINNKYMPTEFIPTNMSGIMVQLLRDLFRSPHTNSHKLHDVMNKLMELSFEGISNGKVTFTEKDLADSNLTAEEATAVTIFVPSQSRKQVRLLEGKNLLFFCHQCVQELFAALWIVKMEEEDFFKVIDENMPNPEFCVVRRFLCGLLLNETVYNDAVKAGLLHDVKNVNKKRIVLRDHLIEQLTKQMDDKQKRLELYISLHEAGEGAAEVINAGMKYIDVHGLKQTSESDMHAIGSVLKYCKTLRSVDLSDCGLTPTKIASLNCGIELDRARWKIPVDRFIVQYNWDMKEEGITELASVLRKFSTSKLVLDGFEVTVSNLKHLADGLRNCEIKLKKLHIGVFECFVATDEMAEVICQILPYVSLCVKLTGWEFSENGIKTITHALKNGPYRTLVGYGEDGKKPIELERFEDICSVIKENFSVSDMREFARRSDGLKLPFCEVRDIQDDNPLNVAEEKQALLNKWKAYNKDLPVSKLREIIENYKK